MGRGGLRQRAALPADAGRTRQANPANLPGASYGLGLEVVGDPHYHRGEIFGWESVLMASLQTGQVVVLDGNACCVQGAYSLLMALQTFPGDPGIAPLRSTLEEYVSGAVGTQVPSVTGSMVIVALLGPA